MNARDEARALVAKALDLYVSSGQARNATDAVLAAIDASPLVLVQREDVEALIGGENGGGYVRHDHAYPMEVGPHHCAGCDIRDRLILSARSSPGEPR